MFVRLSFLAAIIFLGSGCNRNDDARITVYRIPKETQPESVPQQAARSANAPTAEVHWTAPSGWEEQPASGFRKGSFLVRDADGKTADVSVISFPEAAGGLLANVNRWRNQLKLPPVSDATQAGSPMSVAGRDMFFVDLASEQSINPDGSKSRILGGIFPINGETWFFKMMGSDQLVESQRDAFRQFLESVHLTGGSSAAAESASIPVPMSANASGNKTNAPTPPVIEPSQGAPLQIHPATGMAGKAAFADAAGQLQCRCA